MQPYTVQSGDTFYKIADRLFPNADRWVAGSYLHRAAGAPDVIQPDQILWFDPTHPALADKEVPPVEEPPAEEPTSGFPDETTTGLSDPSAVVAGPSVTTTHDGQVIENIECSRIKIRHRNVTVRNCRVKSSPTITSYTMIDVTHTDDLGAIIEDCEVDGNGNYGAIGVYGSGYTLRRTHIHGCRTSCQVVNNCTVEDNLFHDHSFGPGTHGTAISCHGGGGHIIRNNTLTQGLSGASSALSLYGDFAPLDDILIEGNIFNGGSYCTYGGSIDVKPYPDATNIRYINNAFGRDVHSECGRYGPVTSFDLDAEGNEWSGNYWADTLEEVLASTSQP